MAKVLPLSGGIDASALRAGLARASAMEQGFLPFRKNMQLGDTSLWFRKAATGEVTVFVGGGPAALTMDAGLIDLVTISEGSRDRFKRGLRHDTLSTQAINANFTVTPTAGAWQTWLTTDPTAVPNNQIVGTVTFEPFTGHLKPGTAAASFTPKRKAIDPPPLDPPPWIDDPTDDALVAKKVAALKCPASMFTGRTRLYVQALYGRPIYSPQSDSSTGESTPIFGSVSLGGDQMPSLRVTAFKRTDDKVEYADFPIYTSTGLRFDPVTGQHWLINVGGDRLLVCPLKATPAGEKARKFLAGKTLAKTNPAVGLNPADLEQLEAFILAYSLPDVKNQFEVMTTAPTGPSYSMGYGWHWNYSGTMADIVTASSYDQGIVGGFQYTGMETTHRGMNVSIGVDGTWRAVVTVIEGPVQWGVNRAKWCIAEPDWGVMAHAKSTPKYSSMIEADAPFYAFYRKDALQLCRVKVQLIAGTARNRTHSVAFASDIYNDAPAQYTAGFLDGFCDDADAVSAYIAGTFSCGSSATPLLQIARSESHHRWDVGQKSFIDEGARVPGNDGGVLDGTSAPVETGYDAIWGGSGYQTLLITGPGTLTIDLPPNIRVTNSEVFKTITDDSMATIVVPFMDAEAILMEAATYHNETSTGQLVEVRQTQGLGTSRRFAPRNSDFGGHMYRWTTGGLGGLISTNSPPTTSVDTNTDMQVLACIAGTPTIVMGDLGSFHNGEDYAQVVYNVLSGTKNVNPTVLAQVLAPSIGVIGTVPNNVALVGWI